VWGGHITVSQRDRWGNLVIMEVRFTPELQEKIDRAAAENHRDAGELVQEIVKQHLDHDAWYRALVQQGIDELDRGEFVTDDEVWAQIDKTLKA
jgi:predicted transcriptional regulator